MALPHRFQGPQFSDFESDLKVAELSPVQEVTFKKQVGSRFNFQQRIRKDEMVIRAKVGDQLLDGYDFNLRFRYKIQAAYL